MDALLSIKPEFAEKILSGKKQYEFRRTSFKSTEDIDFVYLYSSAPIMKIVGGFSTVRVVEADPEQLWDLFSDEAGIDRDRFMAYFNDVQTGYAIQVNDTYRFKEPIDPNEVFNDFSAPMSFMYLDKNRSNLLQQQLPSRFHKPQETNLNQYSKGERWARGKPHELCNVLEMSFHIYLNGGPYPAETICQDTLACLRKFDTARRTYPCSSPSYISEARAT